MIERIARELFVMFRGVKPLLGEAWRDYEDDARAVLEALREPTPGMVEAGAVRLSMLDPDERGLPEGEDMAKFYRKLAIGCHQAMIDAALSEQP